MPTMIIMTKSLAVFLPIQAINVIIDSYRLIKMKFCFFRVKEIIKLVLKEPNLYQTLVKMRAEDDVM